MEIRLLFAGLVVLTVLFAGCSGEAPQGNATTVPTTPVIQAKFTSGDIIAKSASSADTFWLIVKYDATTDKYERAFIYKKSDGTWYRKDAKTDMYDRILMERLYPAKIAHVPSISYVPVATPAATTAPTTAPVPTATTTTLPAPAVTGITPASGMVGTTANITGITGINFRPGVAVKLVRGTYSLAGVGVNAISATKITCQFVILPSTQTGTWNLTVTNPDGQSGTLANAFTITNTTTTTQPTTTATTSIPLPVANFTGYPTSGINNLTVFFTDTSTGSPTSWSWIFGDIGAGNTSTSQSPWHHYTMNGTFSVKLTVSNAGGNSTILRSNYIIVT